MTEEEIRELADAEGAGAEGKRKKKARRGKTMEANRGKASGGGAE